MDIQYKTAVYRHFISLLALQLMVLCSTAEKNTLFYKLCVLFHFCLATCVHHDTLHAMEVSWPRYLFYV